MGDILVILITLTIIILFVIASYVTIGLGIKFLITLSSWEQFLIMGIVSFSLLLLSVVLLIWIVEANK